MISHISTDRIMNKMWPKPTVTKVKHQFHTENCLKSFMQMSNPSHATWLNSTTSFCMQRGTLSLIKYAQPNPISGVIVEIIPDGGKKNEPRQRGRLLLNWVGFVLYQKKKEKKKERPPPQRKRAQSKHMLCWPTMRHGRKRQPGGPIVSAHQKAALTVTSAVSKADTVSHHGKIV